MTILATSSKVYTASSIEDGPPNLEPEKSAKMPVWRQFLKLMTQILYQDPAMAMTQDQVQVWSEDAKQDQGPRTRR